MFERILVAVDGGEVSNLALAEAVQLANQLQSQLRIVSVVDLTSLYLPHGGGLYAGEIELRIVADTQRFLDGAAAIARREGVAAETRLRRSIGRRVGDEIVAEAEEWPAELIVLGTHGRSGVERLFLGSVAEGVARAASVPVLLVRGPRETTQTRGSAERASGDEG